MRYDFVTATLSQFIAAGNGLTTPQGLVFDDAGNLYVANGDGGNVLRFDAEGNFDRVFVDAGSRRIGQRRRCVVRR